MAKLAHVVLFGLALSLAVPSVPAPAQTIQTVVGGGFTAPTQPYIAQLNFSVGLTEAVAADTSGNVYVADVTHGSVYRVAGNSVSVVAGNGTPGNTPVLQNPTGLAVDGNGNLFIADRDAGMVYKVAKSSGAVQVVAGCGSINNPSCPIQPNYGDGGKATSAFMEPASVSVDSSGNIFIADFGTCRIREVDATHGIITTVAGSTCPTDAPATSGQLYPPQGVTVDSSGDIFFADTDRLVREVCGSGGACGTPGTIRTVAGGGMTAITSGLTGVRATDVQFVSPQGLAVDLSGNLYIADFDQDVVVVVNTSTSPTTVEGQTVQPGYIMVVAGTVSSPGSSPINNVNDEYNLNGPAGLALTDFGDLYIADSLNYAVRSVDTTTVGGYLEAVAGNNTADSFVGGQNPLSIQLATPVAVSEDASANIYLSQSSFANIDYFISQGGATSRLFEAIPSTPAIKLIATPSLPPIGLFLDNADNVFFADGGLEKLSQAYGVVPIPVNFLANQDDSSFLDLTGDNANNLYFTGYARHPGVVDFIADYSSSAFLVNPGVALQPGGYPYSPEALGDGKPAQDAQFLNISGLCTDSHNNIYVTDNVTNLVRVINTGQQATTIAGVTVPGSSIETIAGGGGTLPMDQTTHFDYGAEQIGDGGQATNALLSPQDCFVDNVGNVFIADGYNDRIRRVDSNTDEITTVAGSQFPGFSGDKGPPTSATLNFPNSVWGDQAGNLLISDSGNHRIREVSGILPVPNASLSCQNCSLSNATGSNPTATIVLTNVGAAPLVMSTAPSLTDAKDFNISGSTCPLHLPGLAPSTSCKVTVVATGTVAATTNLAFDDNAFQNENASKAGPDAANMGQWSGYLQYSDPITSKYFSATGNFDPLSLLFTAENVPQSIQVTNTSSVPLTVSSVTIPAPFAPEINPPSDSCGKVPFSVSPMGCRIYIVFGPPTSAGAGNTPAVTISDNTTAGEESIPLLGYALVPSGSTSFNISSSAAQPVTATFNLVGIPSSASVSPLCSVSPAGLDVTCAYDSTNQNITATASIPSCVQTGSADSPVQGAGARYVSLAIAGIALLLPWRRVRGKRLLALIAMAVLAYAAGGLSACSSTNHVSSSCVASVPPGTTFQLDVTANAGTAGQFPSLTLTTPDVISVTK
jgi:sugar lactone lactonase YvrE